MKISTGNEGNSLRLGRQVLHLAWRGVHSRVSVVGFGTVGHLVIQKFDR